MSSTATLPLKGSKQRRIDACINASPRARLWNILSYLSILLVGIPFWWHTTTIERRPLPTGQVEGMDFSHADMQSIPVVFSASPRFITDQQERREFASRTVGACERYCLANQLDCERFAWNNQVDIEAENALQVRFDSSTGRAPYISMAGQHGGDLIIEVPYEHATTDVLMDGLAAQIYTALSDLVPARPNPRPARAIKYSRRVNLAFSLLNEDSTLGGGAFDWDIEAAIARSLEPYLAPLRDLYDFAIESQILYHAPLKSAPIQEETGEWVVTKEHMKTFVNNEQWTLDSGSSNDPVLRFLLFIPSLKHSPLRLETSDESPAFLIPQIGGVVIHQDTAVENADTTQGLPTARRLELAELELPFAYFASQLYALLGVPPLDPRYRTYRTVDQKDGGGILPMTQWQKVNLMRSITESNLREAKGTLISITRLVARIKEMVINKEVRSDVEGAVNALQKLAVRVPASAAGLRDLFLTAREAAQLANKAFFNPSMMGLLYFPDEHKYAVYTPLFAPVAVPVLVALLKEIKGWRGRRSRTT